MLAATLHRGTLIALALAAPLLWVACSDTDPLPRSGADTEAGVGGGEGDSGDTIDPAVDGGSKDSGKDAPPGDGGATCGNRAFCSSGAAPLNTPPPVVAADGYLEAFATAVCARVQQCCAAGDLATFWTKGYGFKTPPTAATCVETVKGNYAHFAAWLPSVTKGHISYDPARASSCVDAVNKAACGFPLFDAVFTGRCAGNRGNDVFKKVAPVGGECTSIKDSTLIGDCDPATGFCLSPEAGADGTCTSWAQPGEKCTIFGAKKYCSPRLNCEGMSFSTPGTCSGAEITRALGAKCNSLSGPAEVCDTGLYCDVFGSGVCKKLQPDGTPCTADDQCEAQHPFSCLAGGGK